MERSLEPQLPATDQPAPLAAPAAGWLLATGISGLCTGVGSYWLASVYDAQLQTQALSWLVVGFVLLPTLFTIALAGVAATLSMLLLTLALPAALLRRPTGLGDLLRDLWRLPAHVVPGFWAALRRVRRPRLWGALFGFTIGTVIYVVTNGFVTTHG